MASNPKIVALTKTLLDASRKGRLQWAEDATPRSYKIVLDPATVSIDEQYLDEGGVEYTISLFDKNSKLLEFEIIEQGDELFDAVEELHNLARKSALRVDDVIDRVIADVIRRGA